MTAVTPRIALCGKGTLACLATEYVADLQLAGLVTHGRVVVPVDSDRGEDTWEPSLRRLCAARGIARVERTADARLGEQDVLFSLQYDRIIRLPDLNGARAFNLHFSVLPDYRGCFPSMWPIRNGEAEAGVTLHVLTAGIDDGPIVDQQRFPLSAFVTAFDLYVLNHVHGYEVFKRNLAAILAKREIATPQPPGLHRYYDRRSIDFSALELVAFEQRTVADCVGFLKSMIFPPFQVPTLQGGRVIAAEAVEWQISPDRLQRLPAIVHRSGSSAILRCKDGLIRVRFAPDAQGER